MKCSHVWIKFGFPFEGRDYIKCEKCYCCKAEKRKKEENIIQEEDINEYIEE